MNSHPSLKDAILIGTPGGPQKLWDCWVYPDWNASSNETLVAPTDDDEPYAAPAGLTIDQVAARLLESELADWGSLVQPNGSIDLAIAIREHGSRQPFRLFRARLMALQAEEVAWPEERAGGQAEAA